MTAAMLEARVDSWTTTDSTPRGRQARDLVDLTSDLTSALNGAIWSYMLGADLEDAFDTALFRAFVAETPTLSGAGAFAGS